ncbi:MoxR family ATPase [Streptomyces sp. ADMS]|uniref:MoxR family ATPase n=1 Tax=Streptomyces sp. ADMS TaxID=3071415 RepID=UPI00296EC78C|nr:MoxR family ATPase [Streptomyces sp. ADMS]MDW4905632.1 MoxR family ATPase [Streptomyces sp. ADMS]
MPPTSEPWGIYRGTGRPGTGAGAGAWPGPPPWRLFDGGPDLPPPPDDPYAPVALGDGAKPFSTAPDEVARVNAALSLGRPLLVTGAPGTGKSAVAHRIGRELGLGRVLHWRITSLSTLQDGLYAGEGRLGPLGTAFLPYRRPRVLLIDRLDRAEITLADDVCTVFEAGGFTVPAGLTRVATDDDPDTTVPVRGQVVRCHTFPVVVVTSSGERDLPADLAGLCVSLPLSVPTRQTLRSIAEARFPDGLEQDVLDAFLDRAEGSEGPAVRRLLDCLHLAAQGALTPLAEDLGWQTAVDTVWQWTATETP